MLLFKGANDDKVETSEQPLWSFVFQFGPYLLNTAN